MKNEEKLKLYKYKYLKNYEDELKDVIIACKYELMDNYNSLDRNVTETYDTFLITMVTGKNSTLTLNFNEHYSTYNDFFGKYNLINANILGVEKAFPLNTDLKDLQNALMVEQYLIEKFLHKTNYSISNSPLLKVKQQLEKDLSKMMKGQSQKLSFDLKNALPEGVFDKIKIKCEKIAQKQKQLIEKKNRISDLDLARNVNF